MKSAKQSYFFVANMSIYSNQVERYRTETTEYAKMGDPVAQFILGYYCYNDHKEAVKWLKKSIMQGYHATSHSRLEIFDYIDNKDQTGYEYHKELMKESMKWLQNLLK